MIDLIAASIKGRLGKNSIIILGLVIAVSSLFIGLNFAKTVEMGIAVNGARLGADLAVVPVGTKENGVEEASQGPPNGKVPTQLGEDLAKISGIDQITPEVKLGNYSMGTGQTINLIAFNPQTDFTIQAWLTRPLSVTPSSQQILVGSNILNSEGKKPQVGDELRLGEQTFRVIGNLDKAGNYMDDAVFKPLGPGESTQGVSRFLLKLKSNIPISLDQYANIIVTNFPQTEVMTRNELSKTLTNQLSGILKGNGLLAAGLFVILAMMLIIAAMFNLTVHEQKKDFGLFQALGATKGQIVQLILGEAFVLAGIGALLGLGIGELLFYNLNHLITASGFMFLAPSFTFQLKVAVLGFVLALLMGAVATLYPSLYISRLDPYDAIRQGE